MVLGTPRYLQHTNTRCSVQSRDNYMSTVCVCDVAVVVDRQNSIWSECSVGGVLRGAGTAVHVPGGSSADAAVSDRTASCTIRCSESSYCHATAKYVVRLMLPHDSWKPYVLLLCFLVF